MKNGIDQGEVISPLLWIIYYNPLFEKLNDHKENAYKISFKFNWVSFMKNICVVMLT